MQKNSCNIVVMFFLFLLVSCGSERAEQNVIIKELPLTVSLSSQIESIWEGQSFQVEFIVSEVSNTDLTIDVDLTGGISSEHKIIINNDKPIVILAGDVNTIINIDIGNLSGEQGRRAVNLVVTSLSNNAQVSPSKSKIDFLILDELKDRLYRPLKIDYETDAKLLLWQQSRSLQFVNVNYAPWSMPNNADWSENPYNNVSWQFYYHSLTWLHTLVYGYEQTNDLQYIVEIKEIIFDWIADNELTENDPNRAWNDHATAYRTAMLAYLYERFFKNEFSTSELALFEMAMLVHGETLNEMLHLPQWVGHNHGLFHSMGLLSAAKVLPHLSPSSYWRVNAVERLNALVKEMIDAEEGVSTEQAISYHYAAIDMFIEVEQLLENLEESANTTIGDALKSLLDFSAMTTLPNGKSPAFGDTNWDANYNEALKLYVKKGLGTERSVYISSQGKSGIQPNLVNVYPDNGYITARSGFSEGTSWMNDSFLFADFGKKRLSHGHHDSLSFTYYQSGKQLLVDSGGPFRYGDRQYKYFATTHAHNTVLVDSDRYIDVDAELNAVAHVEDYTYVNGERTQDKVRFNRSLLTIGSKYLVVVDRLTQSDGFRHWYELLYHFAPKTQVSINDNSTDRRLNFSAKYEQDGIQLYSESSVFSSFKIRESEVIEGRYDEDVSPLNMQGWVSDGYNSKIPAPVLYAKYRTEDIWLVSVFSTSDNESEAKNNTVSAVEEDDGILRVTLMDDSSLYEFKFYNNNDLIYNGSKFECNVYCKP